jgi:ABC-type multidrug transport system permease subunit
MVEIGVAGAFKSVVEKHIENKFFRPSAWVLSSAIVHIPFAFVNLALFFT